MNSNPTEIIINPFPIPNRSAKNPINGANIAANNVSDCDSNDSAVDKTLSSNIELKLAIPIGLRAFSRIK